MDAQTLDFRSDTVTRPTPGMRAAMAAAEVGDDVFDEDPTVHASKSGWPHLLGKEAALFVPSGTMSNQIGIRVHCQPGDEFICEAGCHIYNYEQGGYAQLSLLAVRPVEGREAILRARAARRDWCAATTTTWCGRGWCAWRTRTIAGPGGSSPTKRSRTSASGPIHVGLATHLDGARLLNAAVATGIPLMLWAQHFDTVSVCFSKGSVRRSARRWPARAT